jgi:hypothetical protein
MAKVTESRAGTLTGTGTVEEERRRLARDLLDFVAEIEHAAQLRPMRQLA